MFRKVINAFKDVKLERPLAITTYIGYEGFLPASAGTELETARQNTEKDQKLLIVSVGDKAETLSETNRFRYLEEFVKAKENEAVCVAKINSNGPTTLKLVRNLFEQAGIMTPVEQKAKDKFDEDLNLFALSNELFGPACPNELKIKACTHYRIAHPKNSGLELYDINDDASYTVVDPATHSLGIKSYEIFEGESGPFLDD